MDETLPPSLRGLPASGLPPSLRGLPASDLPPSLRSPAQTLTPAQQRKIPYAIGTPAPPAPAPPPPSTGDYVKGAVEWALEMAAQVTGGTVGMMAGAAGGPGLFGTKTIPGVRPDEQGAVQGGQAGTQAVREGLQALPFARAVRGASALMQGKGLAGALQTAASNTPEPMSPVGQDMVEETNKVLGTMPAIMTGPRGMVGLGAQPTGVGNAIRSLGDPGARAAMTPTLRPAAAAAVERAAAAEKLVRPELEGIRKAHDAGYVTTPTAAKAGAGARYAESFAGQKKLANELAAPNAENTARLARRDVGLPDDVPATSEATAKIRGEAGRDYAVLRDVGEFTPDAQYAAELDRVLADPKQLAKEFPGLLDSPIIKQIEGLKKEGPITTNGAIAVVKELRGMADDVKANPVLRKRYRAAAEAVDNAMDRALTKMADKNPELAGAVDRYRAARVRIAKTYLLDDAMDGKPGEVNAMEYARALDKGAKLTGDALTIAEFGKQFGGEGLAAKKSKSGGTGPTLHDIFLGALIHAPSVLTVGGAILARPLIRKALGSDFAQRRMAGSKPLPEKVVPTPETPPPEPGLTQGFEDVPQGPAPAPERPLGDLTPEWGTEPGASGATRQEVVPTEGLVPAVDEAQTLRLRPAGAALEDTGAALRGAGDQVLAVEGTPGLPDTMVAGGPAEVAATDATGAAMQAPDAALARRQQAAEVERVRARAAESPEVLKVLDEHEKALAKQAAVDAEKARKIQAAAALRKSAGYTTDPALKERLLKRALALEADEKVPAGKTAEGLPKDKPQPEPKPVPKGEATEVPVETIVAEDPTIPVGEATEVTPEVVTVGRKFEIGQTYTDKQGRKAIYQADGTWKIVPK